MHHNPRQAAQILPRSHSMHWLLAQLPAPGSGWVQAWARAVGRQGVWPLLEAGSFVLAPVRGRSEEEVRLAVQPPHAVQTALRAPQLQLWRLLLPSAWPLPGVQWTQRELLWEGLELLCQPLWEWWKQAGLGSGLLRASWGEHWEPDCYLLRDPWGGLVLPGRWESDPPSVPALPALLVPQGLRWAAPLTALQRRGKGPELLLLLLHSTAQLAAAHSNGTSRWLLLRAAAAPLPSPDSCRQVPPQQRLHLQQAALVLALHLPLGPAQHAVHPAWQLPGRP